MLRFNSLTAIILSIMIFAFNNITIAGEDGEIDWGSLRPENTNQSPYDRFRSLYFTPDYDKETIAKYIQEVLPLVEKYTAFKLKKDIKFELVDARKLDLVLKKEMIIQLKNFFPEKPDEIIEAYATKNSRISQSLLGKYGFITKKLYFLPYQFDGILKLHNIDDKYFDNILKLVIAHEMCHMVQDQKIDLISKLLKIKSKQEMMAYNSLLEGHAMFVMSKIAEDLKLNREINEFYKIFSVPDSMKLNPEIKKVNKKIVNDLQQVYLVGQKFVEYHYNRGGNEKVWSIFAKHPRNPDVISNPEQYDHQEEMTKMNLKLCLDFLTQTYNKNDGWINKNVELTNAQIEDVYKDFDPKVKKRIVSNISHNRVFIAKKSDGSFYNVTIIILKEDLKGSKFIKYLEKFVKHNVKKSQEEKVKLLNFKKEKMRFIKADATSKVTMTIDYENVEKKDLIAMRICRKEFFIEIIAMDYKTTDEETKSNVEKVFKLYKDLESGNYERNITDKKYREKYRRYQLSLKKAS